MFYNAYVASYFDFEDDPNFSCYDFDNGIYDGIKIDYQTDYDEVLFYIKELRAILKEDFLNILETRIKYLNNSESLVKEFKIF